MLSLQSKSTCPTPSVATRPVAAAGGKSELVAKMLPPIEWVSVNLARVPSIPMIPAIAIASIITTRSTKVYDTPLPKSPATLSGCLSCGVDLNGLVSLYYSAMVPEKLSDHVKRTIYSTIGWSNCVC